MTSSDIQEREAKYRAAIETSGDGFCITDMTGRFLEFNDAYVNLTGYSREELLNMSVPDIEAQKTAAEIAATIEKARVEGHAIFETKHRSKDGRVWPAELNLSYWPIAGGRIFVFLRDITERKQAEEALRQSQEDLNRAQAVAQTGSWRLAARHNKLLWSNETNRIFGIPQGTPLTYETFLGYVHPEDREYVDHKWTMALQGEPYDIEHRIVVGDTVKWVRERAELEFDPQGQLLGGFGTVQDITDRKQAEEAVRYSNKRTNDILESISDGFFSCDREMVVTYFNHAAGKILGRNRNEVLGRNLFDAFPEARGSIFEEKYAEALREGKFISFEVYFEPQPYQNWYDVRVFPYEEGISVYFQVTTERKRAEEALRDLNEKLEQRVRERTEDLRHTVEVLQEEVIKRQQAEEALKESEAKLRDLARHLLFLQEEERQALSWDLQESLAQSIAVLKMDLRTFEQKLPARNKVLREEYRQTLKQINGIVENLRRRAAELSPQMLADLGLNVGLKGLCESLKFECIFDIDDLSQFFRLEDEVSIYRIVQEALNNVSRHARASLVTLVAKKKDDWVDFLVEDNGQGFDVGVEDVKAGKMGIGLAAMSERVKALGGTFKILSQPAVGTRVFFTIPRTRK